MAEAGDNVAKIELEQFLQRVERLKDEQAEIAEQVKEVKAEAKGRGYDMKAFNAMLSLRAKDTDTRRMIGLYADKLDIFG
jgi:uncharacterized protein (UPF0335 family)